MAYMHEFCNVCTNYQKIIQNCSANYKFVRVKINSKS